MNKKIKGILVFYVDVGQLPPYKAEAFVERMKDQLNKNDFFERLKKQNYEVLLFPVRPNSRTCIDMVPIEPGCIPVINETLVIDQGEIRRQKRKMKKWLAKAKVTKATKS